MKHQLSKSAEPPRRGEAQKALLFEGRRRVPPPPGQGASRLGLKNTSLLAEPLPHYCCDLLHAAHSDFVVARQVVGETWRSQLGRACRG